MCRRVQRRFLTAFSTHIFIFAKRNFDRGEQIFVDYNQNAKDRTTASAYSVRPLPDARVSAPLHWHEVPDANPADFKTLYAISPLHNIRPGSHYPAVMVTTADHDDRVVPAHPIAPVRIN